LGFITGKMPLKPQLLVLWLLRGQKSVFSPPPPWSKKLSWCW